MPRQRKRSVRRSGFTMIEMLVVLAIIVVLLSLTAVAVFRTIGTQQSANTKSELTRIEGEFLKIYRAEVDRIRTEPIPTSGALNTVYYGTVLPMAGTTSLGVADRDRARVIWVNLRLKQMFPQTFNEALNPAPMPPDPYYASVLTQAGYTTANTTVPQPWESSVLLLLALQRGVDGSGVKPEDLGVSSFIHNFNLPAPTNTQPLQGLVDGWGRPLVFSRWPVLSNQLNPGGNPQAGDNNDPVDPSGLLESTTWQGTAGYAWFTSTCHAVPQHIVGQPVTSYRIYPVIASAGADGATGLDPVTFATTNAVQEADNLYPKLATAQ